jgi:hypothetical protein
LFVYPADLIIVQHRSTEYNSEINGFIDRVEPKVGVTQLCKLSRIVNSGIDTTYLASVWNRDSGEILKELPVEPVLTAAGDYWLKVGGLPNTVTLAQGDYIAVGQNVSSDSYFKVGNTALNDQGEIEISATLWTPEIVNQNNIVYNSLNRMVIYIPTTHPKYDVYTNDTSLGWKGFKLLSSYQFPF